MYESNGSYPPRFILNFYNNGRDDADDYCQSVIISTNGVLSTELIHSILLGKKQGLVLQMCNLLYNNIFSFPHHCKQRLELHVAALVQVTQSLPAQQEVCYSPVSKIHVMSNNYFIILFYY